MSVAARRYTTPGDSASTAGAPAAGFAPEEVGAGRARAFPFSIVLLGLVTVLVGAWGGIAPYVGPEFGFVADRAGAWQWTETSAVLALVPGAVALVCGLLVLGAASRVSYGRRADMGLLGLIVAACGAWFALGQYVWPVIDGRLFIAPSGVDHFMWKELCFAIGPAIVLVLCGGVFVGWAVRRQVAGLAGRYPRAVAPAGPRTAPTMSAVAAPPVAAQPVAAPPVAAPPVAEQPPPASPV